MSRDARIETADVVCVASWNADLVSRVPRPIARGETLLARSFDISPGGKGSNAAIACARQGARTAVIARIGREVGVVGLGAWQLGADWGSVSEDDALAVLGAALDAGVTFLDTADVYGDGRS